jgi:outer membrane protein assembly factor BamA
VPGHKLFPLPFVFYQPETKLGGGVGLLHTYRAAADARTSSNGLIFVLTQRKQFSTTLSGERYTAGDRWRLGAAATWSRFPNFFYGIGNDTREADEEAFTPRQVALGVDVRRALRRGLYVGMLAIYQDTRIVEREAGGALDRQTVPGSRGGVLAGVGLTATLDDRDRVYAPRRGRLIGLAGGRYDAAFGSDFELWRAELDVRNYQSLGHRHVLAAQLLATAASGAPAFYDRAALGGANILRGYYEGRYRDRARLVMQLEHRFPVWRRFGGAAFFGVGQAADDPGDVRLDAFHRAGGAGLHWLLSREDGVNLRADVGVGSGDSGVYFAFGDAF